MSDTLVTDEPADITDDKVEWIRARLAKNFRCSLCNGWFTKPEDRVPTYTYETRMCSCPRGVHNSTVYDVDNEDVEVLLDEVDALRADVAHLESRRGAMLDEIDRLQRQSVGGRTVAPTPEEAVKHAANGGSWLLVLHPTRYALPTVRTDDVLAATDLVAMYIPVDRLWAPCAWPTVTT